MNASYLLLDLLFLLVPAILVWRTPAAQRRSYLQPMLILVALTAVFDNAIIAAGIVAYDPAKYLGLRIGLAPVEDFAYAIAAAVMVPWMFRRGGSQS